MPNNNFLRTILGIKREDFEEESDNFDKNSEQNETVQFFEDEDGILSAQYLEDFQERLDRAAEQETGEPVTIPLYNEPMDSQGIGYLGRCSYCGVKRESNEKLCSSCGAPL